MSHICIIKPEFWTDEDVVELSPLSRLTFIGLWTVADREGRFRWKPRTLKVQILPFDKIDFSLILNELEKLGFIYKINLNGEIYGCVREWSRWQRIQSPLDWESRRTTVFERDKYICQYCGTYVDSPHCDHVVPRSRGGSHEIENLVTACPRCNISKKDRTPEEWMP